MLIHSTNCCQPWTPERICKWCNIFYFLLITGNDAKPAVFIFKPSDEQVKEGNPTAVCLINNFFPRDLTVTWKVDSQDVSSSDVKTSDFMQESDSTYSQSSMLTLTKDKWDKADKFECLVKHKTAQLTQSFSKSQCS
ncbi:hypothetical protein XELAEV_18004984mg [Xenopus laevis]|uniref:Ig-like domain-containing protein n=1 Tax=Xenopus laevis TaxID=8355 RepID=A0A974I286_XENLA|nr:hypothetical protein XELAEV_18004984mg [Xenopus laevis]